MLVSYISKVSPTLKHRRGLVTKKSLNKTIGIASTPREQRRMLPHMDDAHEAGRYVSHQGAEYRIRQNRSTGEYYIKPSKGPVPKSLKSTYINFKSAERKLVLFLKKNERVLFKATYPDINFSARR